MMTGKLLYQTGKTANLHLFVTRPTSVLHFLTVLILFFVVLLVFAMPGHMLRHTTQTSGMPPIAQLSLTFSAGLVLMSASRLLLLFIGRRHIFSPAGVVIWLFAELIGSVALMELMMWALSGGGRLALAPLAGDLTLYLIALEVVPYTIAYLLFLLHMEHAEVERLRALVPAEAGDDGTGADQSVKFFDKGGHLALATLRSNVLYIEAANNYTNIHYLNDEHEETFILHNSLKELEQRLRDTSLVRCHRGFIVNVDNVKLMRKDGMGFQLELQGTQRPIPVTKTYADLLTKHISVE